MLTKWLVKVLRCVWQNCLRNLPHNWFTPWHEYQLNIVSSISYKLSFELSWFHGVGLVYLFFSSTVVCFAGSAMASIFFYANSCIQEANKGGMVLFAPPNHRDTKSTAPKSLQVNWSIFNFSSLPLVFLTWLHPDSINLLYFLDSPVLALL